ncbi:hypothetical protein GC176_10955 [bacterium]|nr:hypothetical protein [bacterium]
MCRDRSRLSCLAVALCFFVLFGTDPSFGAADEVVRVAPFSADVTVPLGHRCMGVLPTKSKTIDDPLDARGFVLLSDNQQPIVLLALDWCEVRNGAYDEWRNALAAAAGTTRTRVLLSALHQHDAPVTDSGAQAWLDKVGLQGELYDREFHSDCIRRVCEALKESLATAQPVTHLGLGKARVQGIASSRRVVHPDGRVDFDRYSASGGNAFHANAPEGDIDPLLRTISFWNGDKPLLALHSYATHPMSHYGKGGVSADFVGLARRLRQKDLPGVPQIYVSGCSGDVTAGKFNDGSPQMRPLLAERLHKAMTEAWRATQKQPLTQLAFRSAPLELPFHEGEEFKREQLLAELENGQLKTETRILAAMSLSSLDRVERKQPIDLPCVDFGPAQIVVFPGEAFVGYQLMAQQLSPDTFVMSIGYGESWPGYIPTKAAFDDGFGHGWRWVARGSEAKIVEALKKVLPETHVTK